jgi:hypothetical protein
MSPKEESLLNSSLCFRKRNLSSTHLSVSGRGISPQLISLFLEEESLLNSSLCFRKRNLSSTHLSVSGRGISPQLISLFRKRNLSSTHLSVSTRGISSHLTSLTPEKESLLTSSLWHRRTNLSSSLSAEEQSQAHLYLLSPEDKSLQPLAQDEESLLTSLVDSGREISFPHLAPPLSDSGRGISIQGVTKGCRLPWRINSARIFEPKCWVGEGGGGVVGSQQMSTVCNWSPNIL